MPYPAGASDFTSAPDEPVLNRIIINGDSVLKAAGLVNANIVLDFRHHNIAFDIEGAETNVYQYLLEGYDKKWSSWHELGYKEYTNLPPGKYTFNVRYFTGSKTGEITLFSFKVLPLWYFSTIAILFYICIAALFFWFFYNTQNLKFARTQHMLEHQ
jgi:hypothetical protein